MRFSLPSDRQTETELFASVAFWTDRGEWGWLDFLGKKQMRILIRTLIGGLPAVTEAEQMTLDFDSRPAVTICAGDEENLAACEEEEEGIPDWLGF